VTHDHQPSAEHDAFEASEDAELGRVLEAYLADLEAGRPASPERLLAEHPAIARQLRACLQVMNLAERVGEASGTTAGREQGILTTLSLGSGPPPLIHLRDLPDECEPLVKPRSNDLPATNGTSLGRYQIQGEIARGSMGAILKGRDVDLGRELALKVLLESHQRNPDVARRFVEEAQIGGQLQHPGIAPVYELGTFPEPDRRPYFAMKLVKGQTLAAFLAERNTGEDPRFLSIFEAVCQTMAYAHARGVIHRDLKPSNVMVGNFGEVQVMDWGLAKVLPRGGIADEHPAPAESATAIMTVRSGSDADASHAGSVLGTPSYMSPEQARGEVVRIHERAHVFGLGAILCEILTGRPPYTGATREEIHAKAARGDLAAAWGRLDACGAEPELVVLAKDCLAAELANRLHDAGAVARRMTAHLAGVQDRLRAAELARVEAQTRAAEERKRRRVTAALAVSVLITAGILGGGWAYLAHQRATRRGAIQQGVAAALAEARTYRDQAWKATATGNMDHWSMAMAAARHARDLADQPEADAALRDDVNAELGDLERERDEAAAERRLLEELEGVRIGSVDQVDPGRVDASYAATFRRLGIDIDRIVPAEAGKRIAGRSVRVELASFVDDWAWRRRRARNEADQTSWRRLLAVADAADPDPWRVALREQASRNDREALRRLAYDHSNLDTQPAASLVLLASALQVLGDRDRAERVLRQGWQRSPGDFWVNFALGTAFWLDGRHHNPQEAARHYACAVAVRPESCGAHNRLACVLDDQERHDEAIAEYRAAIRLKPDFPHAHLNLGVVLGGQGKLDEAIAEFREAIRLRPDFPEAHSNLGSCLRAQGDLSGAVAALRKARELAAIDPRFADPEWLKARGSLVDDSRYLQELEQFLAATERQAALAARLPAVLRGEEKPRDAAERLEFGLLCYNLKRFSTAARLITEAFRADPKLAQDMKVQNRYNAVCAAALAGCGQGKDEPPLDDAGKARWRKQAVEWLRADLAFWTKQVESGPSEARAAVVQTLQHWKADLDLAGIRDSASLAKLPEAKQKACRAHWAEVDTLLAKARATAKP
jgi:serine/threonine-protein kinase